MQGFDRQSLSVNGIDTVYYTAGRGTPLVYLHGAGTLSGFEFARPWAEQFRVILPFHPGFGESGDDPLISDIHDYVLHYLELFDRIGLERVNLVGQSMGGFIASKFAIEHSARLNRLVLVCPIGVEVPEHPTTDIFALPPQDLPATLAVDVNVVLKHVPKEPGPDFFAARQRETESARRVIGAATYDRKLPRHLHRISVPTMLVWGAADRLTPAAQLETWRRLLPSAQARLFEKAGHLVLDEAPRSVEEIASFCAA
jgi:pimeloyl-ACP methyl ester carboxylesterase